VKNSKEIDTYIPKSVQEIIRQLKPLEYALKQCTYINKRARIAQVLALRFVNERKPINARWFELIEDSKKWVKSLLPHKYRFDAILFGDGIKSFFNYPQPEKRLWFQLEFIRQHRKKMVDLKTTRQWMSFDKDSRGPPLPSVEDWVIEEHAQRHDQREYDYIGPSPSDSKYNAGYRRSGY
jgi:hypothetical protein